MTKSTGRSIKYSNHRGDFETCPWCEQKFEYDIWDSNAKEVRFSQTINFSKSGKAIVLSDCLKCSGDSWVHQELSSFKWNDNFSKWKAKAEKENIKQHLEAIRSLNGCLCVGCKKIESLTVDSKAWRHCEIGSGPVLQVCDAAELL